MRYTILFSISVLLLVSCKKNKYNTVPSLKFESANTSVIKYGTILRLTLKFTDLEGDVIADSALYIEKYEPKCANSGSRQWQALPSFPTSKNQEGEIVVTFGYRVSDPTLQTLKEPQCGRNDTCIFKFVLRDKAKHISDTAVSGKIVIIK